MRISAPPIKHPCHYGIDMSTREEMIAHGARPRRSPPSWGATRCTICRWRASTRRSAGRATRTCDACFSGEYPLLDGGAGKRQVRAGARVAAGARLTLALDDARVEGLCAFYGVVASASEDARLVNVGDVQACVVPASRVASIPNGVVYRSSDALVEALPRLAEVYGDLPFLVWLRPGDAEAARACEAAGLRHDASPAFMGLRALGHRAPRAGRSRPRRPTGRPRRRSTSARTGCRRGRLPGIFGSGGPSPPARLYGARFDGRVVSVVVTVDARHAPRLLPRGDPPRRPAPRPRRRAHAGGGGPRPARAGSRPRRSRPRRPASPCMPAWASSGSGRSSSTSGGRDGRAASAAARLARAVAPAARGPTSPA